MRQTLKFDYLETFKSAIRTTRYWDDDLPTNGVIAKFALRDLEPFFGDTNFKVLIYLKR